MGFSITIDTTQLTSPYFLIENQYDPSGEDARNFLPWDHTEENPRKPPRAVWDLDPGTYRFMLFASYPGGIWPNPAVSFDVTPEGSVNYSEDCDGFLTGRGTATLTVVGYEVAIDAHHLSAPNTCLANIPQVHHFATHKTLRLMPATYRVYQGTTVESTNFSFDLTRDGQLTYEPAFDTANGGFLAGLGTANLEVIGYPIQIDATQLVYLDFIIPGVTDWTKNDAPQTLNLLPDTYNFQVASGFYCDFGFEITQQGKIQYSQEEEFHHDQFLQGRGTTTLTLLGYEVTLDARHLPPPGVAFWNMHSLAMQHKTFRMVPATWHTVTQGFVTDALPVIRLKLDGTFDLGKQAVDGEVLPPNAVGYFIPEPAYDLDKGGFVDGRGTSSLTLYGFPVLIDARAIEDAGLGMVYLDGFTSDTSVHLVNLLPTTYTLVLNGLHTNFKFQFKLDTSGQLSFEPNLDGFLRIETLHNVPVLKVLAILF